MEIKELENITDEKWDILISKYRTKYFFHQSEWLDFLKRSQNCKILKLEIKENSEVTGYFSGILIKKGIYKILGSPLPGTSTDYMGMIVDSSDFNLESFLSGMDSYCKKNDIKHIEICNPFLDEEIMKKNNYCPVETGTYVIPVENDENKIWNNLDCKFRNRIRKAIKNNISIEKTGEKKFIYEYYNQLEKVFKKQKLVPTYNIDRVESIYNCLKKESVTYLQAKYQNETIAAAIFLHDDKRIYFWGGASLAEYNHLCPNDLMQWEVLKISSRMGMREYDTCGPGSFKKKLGYPFTTFKRYYKSYSPFLKYGRKIYQNVFFLKQKTRGILRNIIDK